MLFRSVDRPNGTGAMLSSPNAKTTGFHGKHAGRLVNGLDVSGSYRIHVAATVKGQQLVDEISIIVLPERLTRVPAGGSGAATKTNESAKAAVGRGAMIGCGVARRRRIRRDMCC